MASARSNLDGGTATLKIGLGSGIGAVSMATAIRDIIKLFPGILIHIEEAASAHLVEAMLMNMLDCALLAGTSHLPNRLNRWPLYSDRAVAVLPHGHKLLDREVISARDIRDETILVGEFCGEFASELVKNTSYPLRLQRCIGDMCHIQDLIGAGVGIALLSDRLRIASPLRTRPLLEPETIRQIVLTSVSGRPLNAAATIFLKICRTQSVV